MLKGKDLLMTVGMVDTSMKIENKIYVAGHRGLLGSALVRKLRENNYRNIVFQSSDELDLRDQSQVRNFFEKERPEYVFSLRRHVVV